MARAIGNLQFWECIELTKYVQGDRYARRTLEKMKVPHNGILLSKDVGGRHQTMFWFYRTTKRPMRDLDLISEWDSKCEEEQKQNLSQVSLYISQADKNQLHKKLDLVSKISKGVIKSIYHILVQNSDPEFVKMTKF